MVLSPDLELGEAMKVTGTQAKEPLADLANPHPDTSSSLHEHVISECVGRLRGAGPEGFTSFESPSRSGPILQFPFQKSLEVCSPSQKPAEGPVGPMMLQTPSEVPANGSLSEKPLEVPSASSPSQLTPRRDRLQKSSPGQGYPRGGSPVVLGAAAAAAEVLAAQNLPRVTRLLEEVTAADSAATGPLVVKLSVKDRGRSLRSQSKMTDPPLPPRAESPATEGLSVFSEGQVSVVQAASKRMTRASTLQPKALKSTPEDPLPAPQEGEISVEVRLTCQHCGKEFEGSEVVAARRLKGHLVKCPSRGGRQRSRKGRKPSATCQPDSPPAVTGTTCARLLTWKAIEKQKTAYIRSHYGRGARAEIPDPEDSPVEEVLRNTRNLKRRVRFADVAEVIEEVEVKAPEHCAEHDGLKGILKTPPWKKQRIEEESPGRRVAMRKGDLRVVIKFPKGSQEPPALVDNCEGGLARMKKAECRRGRSKKDFDNGVQAEDNRIKNRMPRKTRSLNAIQEDTKGLESEEEHHQGVVEMGWMKGVQKKQGGRLTNSGKQGTSELRTGASEADSAQENEKDLKRKPPSPKPVEESVKDLAPEPREEIAVESNPEVAKGETRQKVKRKKGKGRKKKALLRSPRSTEKALATAWERLQAGGSFESFTLVSISTQTMDLTKVDNSPSSAAFEDPKSADSAKEPSTPPRGGDKRPRRLPARFRDEAETGFAKKKEKKQKRKGKGPRSAEVEAFRVATSEGGSVQTEGEGGLTILWEGDGAVACFGGSKEAGGGEQEETGEEGQVAVREEVARVGPGAVSGQVALVLRTHSGGQRNLQQEGSVNEGLEGCASLSADLLTLAADELGLHQVPLKRLPLEVLGTAEASQVDQGSREHRTDAETCRGSPELCSEPALGQPRGEETEEGEKQDGTFQAITEAARGTGSHLVITDSAPEDKPAGDFWPDAWPENPHQREQGGSNDPPESLPSADLIPDVEFIGEVKEHCDSPAHEMDPCQGICSPQSVLPPQEDDIAAGLDGCLEDGLEGLAEGLEKALAGDLEAVGLDNLMSEMQGGNVVAVRRALTAAGVTERRAIDAANGRGGAGQGLSLGRAVCPNCGKEFDDRKGNPFRRIIGHLRVCKRGRPYKPGDGVLYQPKEGQPPRIYASGVKLSLAAIDATFSPKPSSKSTPRSPSFFSPKSPSKRKSDDLDGSKCKRAKCIDKNEEHLSKEAQVFKRIQERARARRGKSSEVASPLTSPGSNLNLPAAKGDQSSNMDVVTSPKGHLESQQKPGKPREKGKLIKGSDHCTAEVTDLTDVSRGSQVSGKQTGKLKSLKRLVDDDSEAQPVMLESRLMALHKAGKQAAKENVFKRAQVGAKGGMEEDMWECKRCGMVVDKKYKDIIASHQSQCLKLLGVPDLSPEGAKPDLWQCSNCRGTLDKGLPFSQQKIAAHVRHCQKWLDQGRQPPSATSPDRAMIAPFKELGTSRDSPSQQLVPEDDVCGVCGLGDSDDLNEIVYCDGCDVKVHQLCYGVLKLPPIDEPWFCRVCEAGEKDPVCVLCLQSSGAMTQTSRGGIPLAQLMTPVDDSPLRTKHLKSTPPPTTSTPQAGTPLWPPLLPPPPPSRSPMEEVVDKALRPSVSGGLQGGRKKKGGEERGWVHTSCAMWMPDTVCGKMDEVADFDCSGVDLGRFKLLCCLCKRKGGACIQCHAKGCAVPFHAFCGLSQNLLLMVERPDPTLGIAFVARCPKHIRKYPKQATQPAPLTKPPSMSIQPPPISPGLPGVLDMKSPKGVEWEVEGGSSRTSIWPWKKMRRTWSKLGGVRWGAEIEAPQERRMSGGGAVEGKPSAKGREPSGSHIDDSRVKAQTKLRRLVVDKSAIHALGVYTLEPIQEGHGVMEYVGETIRSSVADAREAAHNSQGLQRECYLFHLDDEQVIDATIRGGKARFVNHSCEPNCNIRVLSADGEKKVVIVAARSVEAGEELTYDYKFAAEGDVFKTPCYCGSATCRGSIK